MVSEIRSFLSRHIGTVLNFFLNPIGWRTHGSSDRLARWFVRQEDSDEQYDNNKKKNLSSFHYEGVLFKPAIGFSFEINNDSEDSIFIVVSIPFILTSYIVFSLNNLNWIKKHTGDYDNKEWKLLLDSFGLYLYFGYCSDTMYNAAKGFNKVYYWVDFNGRAKYTCNVITRETHQFTQPAYRTYTESIHTAILTKNKQVWKWSRFIPWRRTRLSWEVSFDHDKNTPPMFGGKGENAWDQGDDYISSVSFEVQTAEEAIQKYTALVQKYRVERG